MIFVLVVVNIITLSYFLKEKAKVQRSLSLLKANKGGLYKKPLVLIGQFLPLAVTWYMAVGTFVCSLAAIIVALS